MSVIAILRKGSLLFFLALLTTSVYAETYAIDPVHSTIGFGATHLMVSQVKGQFTDYQGTVTFDPANADTNAADVTIQAKSVDTGNADRDKHLSGPDFLDVEKFPTLTFKSNSIKKEGDKYSISGDLTIHGVTKPITIPATINGPVKSPFGTHVIGISGQKTINRKDFGIEFNKQMDQGGYVVGEEILLDISVEASKK